MIRLRSCSVTTDPIPIRVQLAATAILALIRYLARCLLVNGTIVPLAPLPAWTEGLALVLSPFALAVLFRARPRDLGMILVAGVVTFGVARM